MDAKTRQLMKTKQGKVETGSGSPGGSDGYEGQVQVRDTKDGPMLFAKLKGKWIQSPLLPGGNFFIPKAHTAKVVLPSAANKAFYVVPKFISIPDILYIGVIAILTSATSTLYTQLPATDQSLTALSSQMLTIKAETRELFMANSFATTWAGKKARLTIFYK